MIDNIILWKSLEETRHILQLIRTEIDQTRQAVYSGSCFNSDRSTEVDYAMKVGYLQGLEYLESLLKFED